MLAEPVRRADRDGGEQSTNVLVTMYREWLELHAKVCKIALDGDVDNRVARNLESTTSELVTSLIRALATVELTSLQREQVRAALAHELRAL